MRGRASRGSRVCLMRAGVWVAASIGPSATWAQPGNPKANYDQPLSSTTGSVAPGMVEAGGGLKCFTYRQFTVKQLDSGTPEGDVSITIVPKGPATQRSACSLAPEPGQIVVKASGTTFVAVKGSFIVMEQANPLGAVRVVVLDRRDGRIRYSDTMFQQPNGTITSISDENDVLRLGYTRGINADCSIPQGKTACFQRIARENRLPSSVTMEKVSFDVCVSVYQYLKTPLKDPSILTYAVDISVPPSGQAQVNSRTAPSCYPMP